MQEDIFDVVQNNEIVGTDKSISNSATISGNNTKSKLFI